MKKRIKITNEEIKSLLGAEPVEFPKYATQIINLANQNAQGTRPAVVGQRSSKRGLIFNIDKRVVDMI
jgi:hypothetical protein